MLFFISLSLLAVARAMPDGTIACDPALRPAVITVDDTVISSPNFPGTYPVDSICEWSIQAPAGYGIQVAFSDFNIEECTDCSCDNLEVYNSADDSGTRIRQLCGQRAVPFVQNAGDTAFVRFTADSTDSGSTGFQGVVSFTDNPACATAAVYTEMSGTLTTDNYPQLYPNGADCRWLFFAPNSSYINEITFNDLVTEDSCSGSSTIYDYIEFLGNTDGAVNRYAKWEGDYSGISGATFSSYAGDDFTEIHFVSDVSIPARGASFNWNFVLP